MRIGQDNVTRSSDAMNRPNPFVLPRWFLPFVTWASSFLITTSTLHAQNGGAGGGAVSLPGGPGSMGGLGESFQPSMSTGMGSHSIPLAATVGAGGMAPHLSLQYEGGSGNGLLGLGWSFGPGSIQRRTDKGIPRYIDGPNGMDDDFDGEIDDPGEMDVFIDPSGEELVPMLAGTTTNYFCKIEGGFIRYRRVGDYWEATSPTGSRMIYGQSGSARVVDQENPSHVFQWMLEKEIDNHGNTLEYRYASFPGAENLNEKLLVEVRYGAGSGPWTFFHFVRLHYEDRLDWSEDCRPGFVTRIGKRLARVDMGTQGPTLEGHAHGDFNLDGVSDNLNRRYLLAYQPDAHRSILISVTLIGSDGTSAYPSTTYKYTTANTERSLSAVGRIIDSVNEPASTFENVFVDLVDLNGDGLPDLLQTQNGGGAHYGFINQGQRGVSPGGILWGPAELVSAGPDGLAWSADLGSESAHLADMDGDGLPDLVQVGFDGVNYYRNSPTFGTSTFNWGNRTGLAVQDFAPPSPVSDPEVRTADIDFDKRIDIIKSFSVGDQVGYQVWFNLGKQRYSSRVTVIPPKGYLFSDSGVELTDFNGDRIPDVVRIRPSGLQVITGLGYGRFTDETLVTLPDSEALTDAQIQRSHLEDINGDGLADLVVEEAEPGTLWFWLNQGNYTLDSKREITGLPVAIGNHKIRWADINGNGTTDLVIADDGSIPRIQIVDVGLLLGYAPRANLLTEIRNGFGAVTLLDYSSSVAGMVVDGSDASGHYRYAGSHAMPFPVDVLRRQVEMDGLGGAQETRFTYHDPYYAPVEKQFRGFAHATMTSVGDAGAPSLVTEEFFDTGAVDPVLKGKVLRSVSRQIDGKIFAESRTEWMTHLFGQGMNGVISKWAAASKMITLVYELGDAPPKRIETEMDYDDLGNPTATRAWGLVEEGNRLAGNDESFTLTRYAYNTNDWYIRFPIRTELSDAKGSLISRSDFFYDDETFSGANSGVVVKGDQTLVRSWFDPSSPQGYVRSTRTRYDAYGNPIAIWDPLADVARPDLGHSHEVELDPRFHQFVVRQVNHLGSGHPDLVTRTEYDEGFGVALRMTDPNGFVSRMGYDSFARTLFEVDPGDGDDFPTREFSYAQGMSVANGESIIGYTEARLLDKTPGSIPGAPKEAYYHIGRTYLDGFGRTRMVKSEAEPDPATGKKRYVVSEVMRYNPRGGPSEDWATFFSDTLEFENIENPNGVGWFHLDGDLKLLPLKAAPRVTYRYDALGRVIETSHPDGAIAKTRYEPLLTYFFDENATDVRSPYYGKHTLARRDGLGRTVEWDEVNKLTDDGQEVADFAVWKTRFTYRADGAPLSVTDSQGNSRFTTYDGLGRIIEVNDWDKGRIRLKYDDASNKIERQDAKGLLIRYLYDGGNRVLSEDYLDEGGDSFSYGLKPDVRYDYDGFAGPIDQGDGTTSISTNTLGRLVHVRDSQGDEYFSYDHRGRNTWNVRTLPEPRTGQNVSYRVAQEYDVMGRVSRLTYPDNDFVSYEYNERMLPRKVRGGPNGYIVSDRTYTPSGEVESTDFGNGIRTRYAYDARYRVRNLTTGGGGFGPDGLIAYRYNFDPSSNLQSIEDLRPVSLIPEGDKRRNTQSFQYDSLYRLTGYQVSHSAPHASTRNDGEIRYRYDRIGNLLQQQTSLALEEIGASVTGTGSFSYGGKAGAFSRQGKGDVDAGPHALTSIDRSGQRRVIDYDANGNVLRLGSSTSLQWDILNRLVAYGNGVGRAEYRYNYQGQRVSKTTFAGDRAKDPGTTTLYVSRFFEVRPHDEVVKYVFDAGQRLAQISGTLNASNRVQRLTLLPGWNLKSLTLDSSRVLEKIQSQTSPAVDSVRLWNGSSRALEELGLDSKLPLGSILWIHARASGTFSLTGGDSGTGTITVSPGATFLPVLGPRAFDPTLALPPDAVYWRMPSSGGAWDVHGGVLGREAAEVSPLSPGEALFVTTHSTLTLTGGSSVSHVRYYHGDHLASQLVITDEKGALVEETAYLPFGQTRSHVGHGTDAVPYGFGGKERDAESGLHYFEARYLLSSLGRFVSVDPLDHSSNPQDLNGYAYVGNRPTVFSDPTGLIKNPLSGLFSKKKASPVSLPTMPMASGGHHAERYTSSDNWKEDSGRVVRFSAEENAKMEVFVSKGGKLRYKHNNALIDSSEGDAVGTMVRGGAAFPHTFIFVQTGDGKLYVTRGQPGKYHHSSFTGGGPVAMAGELSVVQGKIVGLSNGSGHYQPPTEKLVAFTERLRTQKARFSSQPKLFDWVAQRVLDGKIQLPSSAAARCGGGSGGR